MLNSCEKVGEQGREVSVREQSEESVAMEQSGNSSVTRPQDDFMTVINRYTENDGQLQQIIQDYHSIFEDKVRNRTRPRHPLVQGQVQESVQKVQSDSSQTLHRMHTIEHGDVMESAMDIYWRNMGTLGVYTLVLWTVYHLL